MSPYKKILCPTDGSATSAVGMREAASLAKSMGAELRFFHVMEFQPAMLGYEGGPVMPAMFDSLRQSSAEVVARAHKFAIDQGVEASVGSVEAIGTRTSDSIIEEARRYGADLIVLGTHGRRGVRRMLLGSDAEAVAREAPCAVLLVRVPESPTQ
jgi:nucleotide-binding universal stress UspA family protein